MKSMLFLNSVPFLKKLAIFTSTFTNINPEKPNRMIISPVFNIFTGLDMITTPIFLIVFSRILCLDIEIDSGFHFLNDIAAGKKVTLSIKAYKMPILKHTPYPSNWFIGAK